MPDIRLGPGLPGNDAQLATGDWRSLDVDLYPGLPGNDVALRPMGIGPNAAEATPDTITGSAALTLGGLGLTARGAVNGEVVVETAAVGSGQYYPYAPLFDRARLERLNRRREEELTVAVPFVAA